MAEWREAPDLRDLAEKIIAKKEDVSHVEVNNVLFLWEIETKPKDKGMEILARTYSLKDHPIGFLTPEAFAIVFYTQHMDYMSDRQRAILMWHELKHIPEKGSKLKPHTVQDFRSILLEAGIDWGDPNGEVPDILE